MRKAIVLAATLFAASSLPAMADSSIDERICDIRANIVQNAYGLGKMGFGLSDIKSLLYSAGGSLDHDSFMAVADMLDSIDMIESKEKAYELAKKHCLERMALERLRW